jgi:hypothetical protein
MLDFNHILSTPGLDVQYFIGQSTATLTQWQTWRKPRGVKNIYILGVGGGASGQVASDTSTSGGGGTSGAQSSVLIPAFFVPDVLYIQSGAGGQQPASLVAGAAQVAGLPTYVTIEPSTTLTANMTFLYANGGTTTTTAPAAATIANMPLAARGFYTLIAGAVGAASSTGVASGAVVQVTGLLPTAGGGGGGPGNAGGSVSFASIGLESNIIPSISGGAASGNGSSGFIDKYFLYSLGGSGGGGGANTNGGNGGPGAGGGGAGAFATTPGGRPGDGGPGFVIIMSW